MTKLSLGSLTVDADVEATRHLYHSLQSVDPECCHSCATFLLLLERRMLRHELLQFMSDAGITPQKPVEAWGAPDGGFLQVWWEFVGNSPDIVSEHGAPVFEPEPGVEYRVTKHHPPSNWAVEHETRLPALEVTWQHDAIRYLEVEAWPEWLRGETDREVGA